MQASVNDSKGQSAAEGCIGGSLLWGAAWCVVQKLSNYAAPLPFRQVPRGHMLCKASWGIPYDRTPPPPLEAENQSSELLSW